MLNSFHCWQFHYENIFNLSPGTIAILYSFIERGYIISYCNAYYLIVLYSNSERNYFAY